MTKLIQKLTSIFRKQTYTVGSITKTFTRPTNSPWKQNLVLEFKDGTVVDLFIELGGSN
jgi:hypothetical protein